MGACQSRRRLVNDGNRGRRKSRGTRGDGGNGNGERRRQRLCLPVYSVTSVTVCSVTSVTHSLGRASERNVVVGERLGGSRAFRDRRRTSAHVILGPGHRADRGAGAP